MFANSRFLTRTARRLRQGVARFSTRTDGVALVEFAMIVPIMVTMYLGMVELSLAVGHERKSTLIARSLSDLTTQSSSVSTSQLDAIFSSASAIIVPYPAADISMRIVSIRIDQANKAFVDWSEVRDVARSAGSYTNYARCTDASSLVPSALRIKGESVVMAWTKVKHKPIVGTLVGNIDMEEVNTMAPRLSKTVTREGVATTPCPGETV